MDRTDKTTEHDLHDGLFGQTDRSSGEYLFKSGNTRQIYSNASYTPLSEDVTPQRYYKPEGKNGPLALVIILCLCCALAGGLVGGLIMTRSFSGRVDSVEDSVRQISEASEAAETEETETEEEASEPVELAPARIYELASRQVVTLRTEYSYTGSGGISWPGTVSGTGFIISDNGYVLTNYHVVEKAFSGSYPVTATAYDGSEYEGKVIAADSENDIAVLKLENCELESVELETGEIRGGDTIYIFGNPYGMLKFTMSTGHVSNPEIFVATEELSEAVEMFQMDISVYEGNSGGPVYNAYGKVIGMVTAMVDMSVGEGIGFAIPAETVERVYSGLQQNGSVSLAAELSASFYEDYNRIYIAYANSPAGALVKEVSPGGCLDLGGIVQGDVVCNIGGYEVSEYCDVSEALKNFAAGDTVTVGFYREGVLMQTIVTLDGK